MKMPAIIRATMNTSRPMPRPVSLPSRVSVSSLICGVNFCVTPVRSVEACSQKAYSGLPTSGQSATDSAGGRIWKLPLLTTVRALSTESASDEPSR
ncbi:hypothetical protein FQZ97_1020560 [compost metagenome]